MQKLVFALCAVATATAAAAAPASAQAPRADVARWQQQASNITITRDDWGIPHVVGKTDADAVFGAIYAQAEDDFNRVETNFINSQGRLAEAEGEAEIWRDLRMKLFINPDTIKAEYASSPESLKKLMVAWADGLNFYLYKHPDVKPRVITHFEPWMALTFSEGSIGGDIEHVNLAQLQAFYGGGAEPTTPSDEDLGIYKEPSGSNGIAIAPKNTTSHHALLWINPHTSFFFRAELQMTSNEGLNAYGASTWGQFFIYQGFNDRIGWMHTTSNADDLDEYAETITQKGGKYFYKYGNEERPVVVTPITVPYKTESGMAHKTFNVYRTIHGPVIRKADGKWVSIRLMQEPVKALTQSYTRTKARTYAEYKKILDLHTNSSNNTIYADADGNIAYFHGNFIPKRDPKFDWTKPVDGSDPATDWKGLLAVDETPNLFNPASGWLFNVNNWPWSAAGASSPKKDNFPIYVEQSRNESPRGVHAIRVLENKTNFTSQSLIDAAFDSYMPSFAIMIPPLVKAYDALPAGDAMKTKLADPIKAFRGWDFRWSATSIPTSLANFYGDDLGRRVGQEARRSGLAADEYMATKATSAQQLASLAAAVDKLTSDFGTWKTPWGDINRYQRLTGDIVQPFNDAGPSIPVPFVSSRWGSLASFGARPYPGTKKWYGTSGNSFVAVVEFGDSVRARAITAGGESGHPESKHFNDEAERYASGNLRNVYFYKSQLKGHTEREYHPGN
jgi:acyl-homoserine-lactone acylase